MILTKRFRFDIIDKYAERREELLTARINELEAEGWAMVGPAIPVNKGREFVCTFRKEEKS